MINAIGDVARPCSSRRQRIEFTCMGASGRSLNGLAVGQRSRMPREEAPGGGNPCGKDDTTGAPGGVRGVRDVIEMALSKPGLEG